MPDWISAQMPQPARRYLAKTGEWHMHVMEFGDGYPVLMLHGNPAWGFLYRKIISALADEPLRIIVPDLIGLGFSDKPQDLRAHQLDAHAAWLGSLLDQLALEQLIFVGQDWGGPVGMRALADRPSLMRGAVILNTVLGPPREGFKPTAFHRFARQPLLSELAFRVLGFPQRDLGRAQGDPASIRGEVSRAYRYPLRGLRRNAAPLAMARMVPDSLEHPSVPALRRVAEYAAAFRGPAEIVWGLKDPVLGRALKRQRELLPQARVTETQGGHFLQEEVPDEIAASVRRVWAQLRSA
ncbi:MAG: alpha/beta fold hydrolase [Bacteroidia bacterium]|nr:alpha/beta fold hydrolase [Bacteroidia bacterium]